MNSLATLSLSLSIILSVACKKKEEAKPTEGTKPTAGAADDKAADKGGKGAAAAASAASCPEGALKNDEFGFCLKVPPNFKELRRNQQMGTENLTYGDPASPNDTFDITVYPKAKEGHFTNELMTPDMIAKNPANKNIEKADLPGGVKYIAHESESGDLETFAAGTGTKASGVVCRTRHSTTFPKPELDAVCKTLVVF